MTGSTSIQGSDHPITFNAYKHHLEFIRLKTVSWREKPWSEIAKELQLIGKNLTDLYYGKLTVAEIFDEVCTYTSSLNINNRASLTNWLNPFAYRKMELSDGSVWVIREGNEQSGFIHIHPGKYSPLTIRVKAPVLKTVIALAVFGLDVEHTELNTINQIRREKLHLSPVKKITSGKGIARMMEAFNLL